MKTLQPEAQPAKARMAPAPEQKTKGAPAVEAFTARELDAAEQLLHLSESSASSGTPRTARQRAPAASGGSFSSRSVGPPPAPPVLLGGCVGGCVDWEEDEDNEVAGRQRRVKRYRLIAEIYAATEEIGGRTGRKNKKE